MKRFLIPLLAAIALPTNAFADTCKSLLYSKGYERSEFTRYKSKTEIQISYSSNSNENWYFSENKFKNCKDPKWSLANQRAMQRDSYYLDFLYCNGYQLYNWNNIIYEGYLYSWENEKATSFLVSKTPTRTTEEECIKVNDYSYKRIRNHSEFMYAPRADIWFEIKLQTITPYKIPNKFTIPPL